MEHLYLSADAHQLVHQARMRLDEHPLVGPDEQCAACAVPEPCAQRRAALRTLGRYRQLPYRRPGATRPDLLDARPAVAGFPWFAAPRG